jgi:AP-2 complex subunit beta-1
VSLLHQSHPIEYVALKSIGLLMQLRSDLMIKEMTAFYCVYNEPIYIKLAKLDILIRLIDASNYKPVLLELNEYASEVDIEFSKKAVHTIGKTAIKIPSSVNECMDILIELLKTGIPYIVQEIAIVSKDIFRKYPGKYETKVLTLLCDNVDIYDEPESKTSIIWIIGHYSDQIPKADQLLTRYLEKYLDEPKEVQLALLTASVKYLIKCPSQGQELLTSVLQVITEKIDNPDLRDRGIMYWRLLSTDPAAAKPIVFSDQSNIEFTVDDLSHEALKDFLLHLATISGISRKPVHFIFGGLKSKTLKESAALVIGREWRQTEDR